MAIAYCNIATDLTDVFPDINDYNEREELKGWVAVTGQSNTYSINGTGQINMVFDDGAMCTVRASIALVQANAGSFFYDTTVDILYVHAFGSDNLTTATILIQSGEDWDGFLDNMRDKAMQWMDSYLNKMYPTPLMPRLIKTHDTADYDYMVVRCCALLTCHFVLLRRDPTDNRALAFYRLCWNSDPGEGEPKGILNQLLDGDAVL